jgi:hypothetical protein
MFNKFSKGDFVKCISGIYFPDTNNKYGIIKTICGNGFDYIVDFGFFSCQIFGGLLEKIEGNKNV